MQYVFKSRELNKRVDAANMRVREYNEKIDSLDNMGLFASGDSESRYIPKKEEFIDFSDPLKSEYVSVDDNYVKKLNRLEALEPLTDDQITLTHVKLFAYEDGYEQGKRCEIHKQAIKKEIDEEFDGCPGFYFLIGILSGAIGSACLTHAMLVN